MTDYPNVLIYVMDSLRANRLGCYGYQKANTHSIDALAKEAVIFENVSAQATWTRPSAVSIFSSLYPSSVGVQTLHDAIPHEIPWLPTIFQQAGYKTTLFSANPIISEPLGFRRGFDLFMDQLTTNSLMSNIPFVTPDEYARHWRPYMNPDTLTVVFSEDLHRFVVEFLEQEHKKEVPWLTLIWSMDTHCPYFDRREKHKYKLLFQAYQALRMNNPQQRRLLSDLYDSMVTYNDLTVGNLLSVLKRLGLYDQTIVVLLGDHGEAFGEHGFNTHSGIPYEEQTHVPLIIKLPYSKFSGISRSSIVQLTDLLPTLIDYCHLPNVEQLQGKSLRSIIEYGDGIICNDQLAFSEGKGYISARTPRWKYISLKHTWSGIGWILRGNIFKHAYWYLKQVKTMKLFDLKKDPGETQNVVFRYPKLQRTFSKCLKTYWQENTNFKTSFSHAKLELDDVVAKRLGDLGYLD